MRGCFGGMPDPPTTDIGISLLFIFTLILSMITLPETNSSHLKMDGWNTSFLLGWPIFRGELLVSGSVHGVTRIYDIPMTKTSEIDR